MASSASAFDSSRCRVGISGWTYAPWRKDFYPDRLPQRKELAYASRQLNSIEINGTFYALQKPASYRKWHAETPADFLFAIKGNRYITHIRRLDDVAAPLANFFASGLLALKEKLGPILWQMPPSFRFNPKVLETFFKQLPRDTEAAGRLAHRHDDTVSGRSVLTPGFDAPIRHAMEIRHASFECEAFVELLREHGVALVIADTAGKWPWIEDMTADFAYLRLHGDKELYASGYTPAALERWAAKIKRWAMGGTPREAKLVTKAGPPLKRGRDVYVYFDNDVKVRAPYDAIALGKRLGLPPPAGLPDEKETAER